MANSLTIRDEEASGRTVNEFSLEFLTERITVRELIRSRVYQEVGDYTAKQSPTEFRGLVQPTAAERTLNGYRLATPRRIDWQDQFERAIEAFEKRWIVILVNDCQVESLDDEIEVATDTLVSFLRLTLLVGG